MSKTVSATIAKTHFGECLDSLSEGPVFVTKTHRPFAVILSAKEYARLQSLEDAYWGSQAEEGEGSGYIGKKKSMALLRELAK